MLQRDDDLERFKKEFNKDNNSIISDNYMGFHRNEKYCCNCKKYLNMSNQKNISKYQYKSFSHLCFDLNKIYDDKKNSFTINNHIANINLDECFKYYNLEKLNVTQNNCLKCQYCQNKALSSIYLLPNILTIVLSNNEKTNFILQNKINLNEYVKEKDNDFNLIAILCQSSLTNRFYPYC